MKFEYLSIGIITVALSILFSVSSAMAQSDSIPAGFVYTIQNDKSAQIERNHNVSRESSIANELLDRIVGGYNNWGRVELSGKLSTPLLPVAVSIKIFMEKDKGFMMSVRAPFMGEVGRVELDKDSLTVVNKMKKKFCRIGMDYIDQAYPGLLPDLQSVILGRIFLMGKGQLTAKNKDNVTVFEDISDCGHYAIIPDKKYQSSLCTYGFMTDAGGKLEEIVVQMNKTGNVASFIYIYENEEKEIHINANFETKVFDATLSLDAPKWGASKMKHFEIDKKYSRVSLAEVFKMK